MSVDLVDIINGIKNTNVTKTIHGKSYDAISPKRPELSQSGKTVLITGGGTNIGLAIAHSFVNASASTVIIVGRRADVLETARAELEAAAGQATKIIVRVCDIGKTDDVDALWNHLRDENIFVDVFISNAAKFTDPSTMMDLGYEETWAHMATNLQAPMYLTDKFYKQAGDKPKYIVNVSTVNIHATGHPIVATQPAYNLSKFAGTLYFQILAQDQPREKLQVVSFHPGVIYNEYWKKFDVDPKNFDDAQLTGDFAVWAASEEAAFFHGRYAWCSWDVNELATGELRKRLDVDFYFLRGTISGLNGQLLA
ncbi:NAD(P)-binding protein [Ophiobolus disseminans]|uniref:NAD(P)-binding protein n=1 Tax=Ophiobolus disseminans TaxID=1469910 RepID=A0A6A7AEM6_9PLEO|nr:NAD(P)-binding protein [Ophiobolus disseminans]